MAKSKIPPIEIDTNEFEKFKLLTQQQGKTMSGILRDMIIEFNKSKLNLMNKSSLDPVKKYRFKASKESGVTSKNYKDYLYGNKSKFNSYDNT